MINTHIMLYKPISEKKLKQRRVLLRLFNGNNPINELCRELKYKFNIYKIYGTKYLRI